MAFRGLRNRFLNGAPERSPSDRPMSMSGWRWLLFMAMARFEIPEETYLRIPNAETTRRDVLVDVHAKREAAAPAENAIE
jgi:hypothetical protein